MKISKTLIIRNKTNSGDLAKTICYVAGHDNNDASLIIRRFILSSDQLLAKMAMPVKVYRAKTLWYQMIAIRLDTLSGINHWLSKIMAYKEFE